MMVFFFSNCCIWDLKKFSRTKCSCNMCVTPLRPKLRTFCYVNFSDFSGEILYFLKCYYILMDKIFKTEPFFPLIFVANISKKKKISLVKKGVTQMLDNIL